MNKNQNARKGRAKSAARKGGKGPGNNRQDNKVRGNPKQHLEKYKKQAQEAQQAGDRVMTEYYLQFADHYQRVLNEMRSNQKDRGQNQNNAGDAGSEDENAVGDDGQQQGRGKNRRGRGGNRGSRGQRAAQADAAESAVDPAEAEQPAEVHPELDLIENGEAEGDKPAPRKRRSPAGRRPRREKSESDTAPAEEQAAADAPQEPTEAA